MARKTKNMFLSLIPVLNDESLSLSQKIERAAHNYMDMLLANPELPILVLTEIRNDPRGFEKSVRLTDNILALHFFKQLRDHNHNVNPFHLINSFLGMLIFPFISKPVFVAAGAITDESFIQLMEERKKLIPGWIHGILQ